jgi:hypothetical protein
MIMHLTLQPQGMENENRDRGIKNGKESMASGHSLKRKAISDATLSRQVTEFCHVIRQQKSLAAYYPLARRERESNPQDPDESAGFKSAAYQSILLLTNNLQRAKRERV